LDVAIAGVKKITARSIG